MNMNDRTRFINLRDKNRKILKNAVYALKEFGLSNQEIAKNLDVPESTVRVALTW